MRCLKPTGRRELTLPQTNPNLRESFTRHDSAEDASVNWDQSVNVGRLEARYVRRKEDYLVVYLSSQTGCDQGCRMCHLTATGQTSLRNVAADEFLAQADVVLNYYRRSAPTARTVHFNFMARGEALANQTLIDGADEVLGTLARRAAALNLRPRYLVSTIMPKQLGGRALEDIFVTYHPEIYYSIYSTNDDFRRRWLPKAMPVADALDRLQAWQRHSYKICKLHYAFIEGENDSEADVNAVCDAVEERKLMTHVNIVRYNSPDIQRRGTESSESVIQRNAEIFRQRMPSARVRVIQRVGFDVNASCGMFKTGDD